MRKESNHQMGFNEVYDSYSKDILNYAKCCTGNPQDGEDIFQEAFLRYYMISQCEKIKYPKGWIGTVVKNQAINLRRARRKIALVGETEELEELGNCEQDIEENFFENMWKRETRAYACEILHGLKEHSDRWYHAIVMVYCMEIPGKEVAQMLNMSRNALDCMLQRAKKWIKENYKEGFSQITK